jgi:hypothetical protein
VEANYMDFGSNDHTVFTDFGVDTYRPCSGGCSFSTNTSVTTVLVGLNWRWGGGGWGTGTW